MNIQGLGGVFAIDLNNSDFSERDNTNVYSLQRYNKNTPG